MEREKGRDQGTGSVARDDALLGKGHMYARDRPSRSPGKT